MKREREKDPAEPSDATTKRRRRRPSLRQCVERAARSFDQEGICGLQETHRQNLEECFGYRILFSLARTFIPLRRLLELGADVEHRLGEVDIHIASQEILARPPIPWQVILPERGEKEIHEASVITYGRHGSILTPFLLAAAFDRPDVKAVAADYVAKLGPNVARFCFAVRASAAVPMRRGGSKGLVPRLVGWVAAKSGRTEARAVIRQWNTEALARAAQHVREGGGVAIAPDARHHREPWRPGIGVLVAALLHDPGARPTYVVSWSIRGASVVGIFQALSRNPLLHRLGMRRFRRPVQVILGEPVPIGRIAELVGDDPIAITQYLEADYRRRGLDRDKRVATRS